MAKGNKDRGGLEKELEMSETREFHHDKAHQALRDCQQAGYRALFMPELIDRRINASKEHRRICDSINFSKEDRIRSMINYRGEYITLWEGVYTTPSIRATWKTKQGSPVVLYIHRKNYYSKTNNIIRGIKQNKQNGLFNNHRAGVYPEEEFYRFVKLAEKGSEGVFLVPHKKLKKSESGVIPIDEALEHPQTIPFLGGEEMAKVYLQEYNEVYNPGYIGSIGVRHCDDLGNEPRARLLCVGRGDSIGGLLGDVGLDDRGLFFGVRDSK